MSGMETTSPRESYSELSEQLESLPDPRQPGRTLDLLARMLDLRDSDLQEQTGFSRNTINRLRNGKLMMNMTHLWPIAEALGVSMADLLRSPGEAAANLLDTRSAQFRCTDWA